MQAMAFRVYVYDERLSRREWEHILQILSPMDQKGLEKWGEVGRGSAFETSANIGSDDKVSGSTGLNGTGSESYDAIFDLMPSTFGESGSFGDLPGGTVVLRRRGRRPGQMERRVHVTWTEVVVRIQDENDNDPVIKWPNATSHLITLQPNFLPGQALGQVSHKLSSAIQCPLGMHTTSLYVLIRIHENT
ncbi:unnamed protein product [Protopolystoma xenopodis]|uniref:Cadherin domain-containing protein n=1 Tax=Protopolystoma xenopodis TaxID=117903 RepID=A0A3S5FEE8_9PLAT|nr:unnamed protein product [Protopolystoma xenopodis]